MIFGFIEDLLGDDEQEVESSGTLDRTSEVSRKGTSTTVGTSTATGKEVEALKTNTLDKGVLRDAKQSIDALVQEELGGTSAADQMQEIATMLLDRAGGAEEALNAQNAAIIAESRRVAEDEMQRLSTELATAAGGTRFNSLVAGATIEGRAAVESQLAALQAQLSMQARDKETQELTNAGEIFSGSAAARSATMNTVSSLISAIKGGKVRGKNVTTTDQTQTEQSAQTFDELINEIVAQQTTGQQTTSDDRGLFDLLDLGVKAYAASQTCWVARAVYGVENPRWLVFRRWLTREAPAWLHRLYVAHGEAFAEHVKRFAWLRRSLRCLMDRVVDPRMPA